MIKIGDKIPYFQLKDNHGKLVISEDFKGKKVLLSFHPLAWTGVCAKQMQSLETNFDKFKNLNTVALGLSIDTTFTKNEWAKSLNVINTPMLSDFWPSGELAIKLGIFRGNDGFSERANIIVNENGIVVFVKVYDIPELPDINEIISFLEKA